MLWSRPGWSAVPGLVAPLARDHHTATACRLVYIPSSKAVAYRLITNSDGRDHAVTGRLHHTVQLQSAMHPTVCPPLLPTTSGCPPPSSLPLFPNQDKAGHISRLHRLSSTSQAV